MDRYRLRSLLSTIAKGGNDYTVDALADLLAEEFKRLETRLAQLERRPVSAVGWMAPPPMID